MAIVEVHGKRGRGLDLMLVEPEYVIGTRGSCDLVIDDDDTVSRLHARIERHKGPSWSVIDAGARNGTLVNGKPLVGEHGLRHGDEIILGRYTKLVFRDAKGEQDKTTTVLEPAPTLTPREHDALVELVRPLYEGGLFQQPASVKDIAAAMFVGVGAVKNHLGSLYLKFGIDCENNTDKRAELARAAWHRGAVGSDDFKKLTG
jgi:pSer/pThr/pTyr-binding forkhead associated (FHA) protein